MAVYGPESAGSPVDWPLNTLARAVDTLSAETPTPHNMMENVAVCVALLLCSQPFGVLPVGSILRAQHYVNSCRWFGPQQIAQIDLRPSVEMTGAECDSTRIHFGVADRSGHHGQQARTALPTVKRLWQLARH